MNTPILHPFPRPAALPTAMTTTTRATPTLMNQMSTTIYVGTGTLEETKTTVYAEPKGYDQTYRTFKDNRAIRATGTKALG